MATTTLTVRDQSLEVTSLPDNIQQAVRFYDTAVEQCQEAESNLVIASSAAKFLLNDITRLVDAYLSAETVSEGDESEEIASE